MSTERINCRFKYSCLAIVFIITMADKLQASTPQTGKERIHIQYGSGSAIIFDKTTRTYAVLTPVKVISGAYASVKINGRDLSSKDYQNVKLSVGNIRDGFGSGKKYVISMSKTGLPAMEQIFYVYPGHDYFFTEVLLKGNGLKTNYMAPLVTDLAELRKGDNRMLFVPFDNDTFIRYSAKAMNTGINGTSAEVGAIYENGSREGLVTGSVEHMIWKTGVFAEGKGDRLTELKVWGGYTDEKVTRDKIAHGSISGNVVKSPKIFFGYFADWRLGLESYGKANRIQEKPYIFNWTKPVPFGWNSWGVIQEKVSYDKAIKVADYFADELSEFRNGNTAYIDLDSFWDNFTGGMRGDYARLKEFADYCKKRGLEPGVYWAPFTDWGYQSKNEREAEGSKYNFSEMWTKVDGGFHDFDGARALDPTHPGTQKRIDYIIEKLKSCGFRMIKIDFLGHAAAESDAFYDKSVTTGMQAYRIGMEHLTDRLNGQMLVYAAISPVLATGRYAHMRRVACDAWKTIKDTEYTLNSVSYGWWQTYVYNFIDADHVVFGSEPEGANKARLASALITGTLILGDDFSVEGEWRNSAFKWLNNKDLLDVARSGRAFMPAEGNTDDKASPLFIRKNDGYLYIALFNYGQERKQFEIPLQRLGLTGRQYTAEELFEHRAIALKKTLRYTLKGADAAILRIRLDK